MIQVYIIYTAETLKLIMFHKKNAKVFFFPAFTYHHLWCGQGRVQSELATLRVAARSICD